MCSAAVCREAEPASSVATLSGWRTVGALTNIGVIEAKLRRLQSERNSAAQRTLDGHGTKRDVTSR
jgi:hypothetical protein